MSLIEAAVQKAKNLTEMGRNRAMTPQPVEPLPEPQPKEPSLAPTQRERMVEPDAAAVAARVAQARVLPIARVDSEAMERNGVLLHVTDNSAQRSYRILRTRLQQRMQAQNWHSVAITSCGVGDGKTLTSINLALALARDVNTWVYLVDLDLQRPQLASYLGLQFDKSLNDYLTGEARFEDILYSPGVERVAIIPCARPVQNASDVLGSPRTRELCRALAAEVPRPIVIFDMPPLLMGDDVLKFHPNVDSTLLVVSEGRTPRSSLEQAQEILQEMSLLGVVLNRSAETLMGSYYYY
jgi:Mrp family chromosome partitioning ATPase